MTTTELSTSQIPLCNARHSKPVSANAASDSSRGAFAHDEPRESIRSTPAAERVEREPRSVMDARAERSESVRRENEQLRELRERDLLARDHIFSVADAMADVAASFGRLQEKARLFRESIRPQFDAAPLLAPCPEHPAEALAKAWEETCLATRKHDVFTLARAQCPACAEAAARASQRAFWRRRGVPERLLDATFANFKADSPEKAAALVKTRESKALFLVLVGTPGAGKSHLAAATLHKHGSGAYITHADMMGDLRASYQTHTTQEVIAAWREVPTLVIDDFGVASTGRDEEPLLYQVLATRHDCRRQTVLTSNLALPDVREILGYRLMDRIGEDCTTVVCSWPSFRTRK